MIENNLLSYLNIGLPEDILRMKLHGDLTVQYDSSTGSSPIRRFRIRSVTA